MITFACPGCGRTLQARDDRAGKQGRCPECGQRAPIPMPSALAGVRAGSERSTGPVAPPPSATPSVPSHAEAAAPPTRTPGPEQDTGVGAPDQTPGFAPGDAQRDLYSFLAPPQQPDEIGRLGPYRVLQVLGRGGMGVVFRAEDSQLRRPVALKAMLPSLANSASNRQRFLREAQSAAAIEHDHIVPIFQVGEDRDVPFLAMPLLRGESLEDRLRREGRLPLPEVLRIGREMAEGLAAAHEKGLVHRDVKPANVWLERERGRVKILDFGLARAVDDGAHLTQSGAIVGTPAYMAPEQMDGQGVDYRADLFSLGCVLYRLATGEQPFQRPDTMSTLMAVATHQPSPPRTLNPEVPPALSNLIVRLLAKTPAGRPRSARAVAQVLQHLPEDQTEVQPSPQAPRGRGGLLRRRFLVATLLGLLGLGGVLAAVGVYRIRTDKGEVVIQTEDPDVEVTIHQGGRLVTILDPKTQHKVELRSGEYEVALAGKTGGLRLSTDTFTLRRGDLVIVSVTRVPAAAASQPPAPPPTPAVTHPPAPPTPAVSQPPPPPVPAGNPSAQPPAPAVIQPATPPTPAVTKPAKTAGPPEVVVSARGGGQYTSLRQAVLDAAPGSTIRVLPGTYNEQTILLHENLTIVGDGPARDVIIDIARTSPHGFHLMAERVTLHNLTVRCHRGNAVWAVKGTNVVEDCDLTSLNEDKGEHAPLAVSTPTPCVVRRCKLHGTLRGCGLVVGQGAQARLEECEIFGNAYQGAWIDTAARATLRKCHIHDNAGNGILFAGAGTVEDCDLLGNAQNGMMVEQGGTPEVRACRISRNMLQGICATGKVTVTLRGCEVHDNGFCGVQFKEGASGEIEGCDLFANTYQGMALDLGSRVSVRKSRFHDNQQNGLALFNKSTGTVEDCDLVGNVRSGIGLTGATAVVRKCRINRNLLRGMYLEHRAAARVEGCDLTGNMAGAWHIDQGCRLDGRDNKY